MKKLLAVFCCALCACQPTTETPRPQAAPQAVGLERVAVQGSCSATLELDLRAGFLMLPVRASLLTTATEGGTRGGVSVDVGGIFTARCEVVDGESKCAQGGLIRPGAPPQDANEQ